MRQRLELRLCLLVCLYSIRSEAWVQSVVSDVRRRGGFGLLERELKVRRIQNVNLRRKATIERAEAEVETRFDLHRLRLVVARMGLVASEAELVSLMRSVDQDKDGEINFSEFVEFLTQQGKEDDDSNLIGRLREALRDNTRLLDPSTSDKDFKTVPDIEKRRLDSNALLNEFEILSKVQHEARVVVGGYRASYTSSFRTGYDARDFLRVVSTWHSSFVLRRVRAPLIAVSLWSLLIAIMHQALSCSQFAASCFVFLGAGAPSAGVAKTMTLSGAVLSLLLVFRTTSANARYAESRLVWTGICSAARDCAEFCQVYVPQISRKRVRRIADLLCAFPLALILYLQGTAISSDPHRALRRHFDRLLDDAKARGYAYVRKPQDDIIKSKKAKKKKSEKKKTIHPAVNSSTTIPSSSSISSAASSKYHPENPILRILQRTGKKLARNRRLSRLALVLRTDFLTASDSHGAEAIPRSLIDNAKRRSRQVRKLEEMNLRSKIRSDDRAVPLEAFVACCRADDKLSATFSLPSDVDPQVALTQLYQLKFGHSRPPKKPVTLSELEAYYNPLTLARLLPPSDRARLARSRCPPLEITRQLMREAKAIPHDDIFFSSRERLNLIKMIGLLRASVGAAERIAQTPVPLHYARHALRFLTIWSFALPLALVEQLGLLTVPATAFFVWALYGLREIGTLIENPFSRPLQLQIVSDTTCIDVRETVDGIEGIDNVYYVGNQGLV